ncbi:MAG: hypothetical protein KJO29_00090 [Bacteroidia bacterium]|nr:hypothetical protein [Bacteroidia bacterium]
MNKRNILTILGFLIFFFGFMALIFSLVGIRFTFLKFIDAPGATFGFVVRLIMVFGGIIMIYISRMDNTVE